MRIGWRGIVLEMGLKNKLDIPKNGPIVMSNLYYIPLPGKRELTKTVDFFLYDVPTSLLLNAAKFGYDELIRQLIVVNNKPNSKPDAVTIISPNTVYTIIFNEDKISYNTDNMNHVFSSQFKFLISINLLNFPSNTIEWAKALQGTLDLPYPKLRCGEIYTCARFGTEWKGLKIQKDME